MHVPINFLKQVVHSLKQLFKVHFSVSRELQPHLRKGWITEVYLCKLMWVKVSTCREERKNEREQSQWLPDIL